MKSIKFNGKNYIYWARFVEFFFERQGFSWSPPIWQAILSCIRKWCHNSDGLTTPTTYVASTSLWDLVDSLIMYLMLSSIETNIRGYLDAFPICEGHLGALAVWVWECYLLVWCLQAILFSSHGICRRGTCTKPLITNFLRMEKLCQDMDMVRFLNGLKSKYEHVWGPFHVASNRF